MDKTGTSQLTLVVLLYTVDHLVNCLSIDLVIAFDLRYKFDKHWFLLFFGHGW